MTGQNDPRSSVGELRGSNAQLGAGYGTSVEHRADMLSKALEYTDADWAVLPLDGKLPRTKHGKNDATTDPDQIRAWWTRWPNANIGIALPDAVIALDIDPRHDGHLGYAQLIGEHGALPDTLAAASGRRDGGMHLYFRHPGGTLTQRELPQGIDLREGGKHYLVAPPSIHPETLQPYRWLRMAPVADCPAWLGDLLRVKPKPAMPRVPRDPFTGGGNGEGLVNFVRGLQAGERNNGLYWAFHKALNDDILGDIEDDLLDAAQSIGLSVDEAKAVLRWGDPVERAKVRAGAK